MEDKIIKIQSAALDRFGNVCPATVEVQITKGIGIHLVGLAQSHVQESLLRVLTALQSLGFHIPGKKIVINISPATVRAFGSHFDLPIAIGVLQASEQISVSEDLLERCVFIGALGLDGSIRQGWPHMGYAIAKSMDRLIGERPLCFVSCTETALEASDVPGVLVYRFSEFGKLLRVLQRDIVGTANLIWNHQSWREKQANSEVWIAKVHHMSELPL